MKRRRTPRKIKASSSSKAPSSSSAKAPSLKTLTQPSKGDKPYSILEGPSLKTLTQGDKPYAITDMLSIYNLSPSEMDEQLKIVREAPTHLKMLAFYYGPRLNNNIKWLGIRPTDMVGQYLDQHNKLTFPMTHKDIKTANFLLKDSYIKNRPEWLEELHIMLKIKRKIEVELLSCFGILDYLTDVLLPMKLQHEDWI